MSLVPPFPPHNTTYRLLALPAHGTLSPAGAQSEYLHLGLLPPPVTRVPGAVHERVNSLAEGQELVEEALAEGNAAIIEYTRRSRRR